MQAQACCSRVYAQPAQMSGSLSCTLQIHSHCSSAICLGTAAAPCCFKHGMRVLSRSLSSTAVHGTLACSRVAPLQMHVQLTIRARTQPFAGVGWPVVAFWPVMVYVALGLSGANAQVALHTTHVCTHMLVGSRALSGCCCSHAECIAKSLPHRTLVRL